MHFSKRLTRERAIWAALAGEVLWLAPCLSWAAGFNQNLGIWQDGAGVAENLSPEETPLVVVDPVGALPPVTKPPQIQAPVKVKAPVTLPAVPSNVEIINKLLTPGASDPNVPLPHPDLADGVGEPTPANGPANSPRIFGRSEQGGGVFGLRLPIPADRRASSPNTRYSVDRPGSEAGPETR